MTIKQHHLRSLLSRYTYSSTNGRRNRHRHSRSYRWFSRTKNHRTINSALSRYLTLPGFGRGPSKNKRYGPLLDNSLLNENVNDNNESDDDDDFVAPKLDKYYINHFLSFLQEDLVKDLMGQRINSRQSTVLKYLRQRYNYYPPQIYKLVTGQRLSNQDLRHYRLRRREEQQQQQQRPMQIDNHHEQQQQQQQHNNSVPSSLTATPIHPPMSPQPPEHQYQENTEAAAQLANLMNDYHSAENVMADVFDEMSRVVANTVNNQQQNTNNNNTNTILPPQNRIAHKAMPPPPSSIIPHKQLPSSSSSSLFSSPPSSPSSLSSVSPTSSFPSLPTLSPSVNFDNDDIENDILNNLHNQSFYGQSENRSSPPAPVPQPQQTPSYLLDPLLSHLNRLTTTPDQEEQQQPIPAKESFNSVLNAYCEGIFNTKETVNEVLRVAQNYLMRTWDQQAAV